MKILMKDINKMIANSTYCARLYISSKYISDGSVAFNRDLISNIGDLINKSITDERICIMENDISFNSVISTFSKTRYDVKYLNTKEVKIDDFIYTDGKILFRKGYTYYTQDRESKVEVCTGINPYYLEMVKRLDKGLKGELKIVEVVYSIKGGSYSSVVGFYRLLDKDNNFLGVVCGAMHDINSLNKIERIKD